MLRNFFLFLNRTVCIKTEGNRNVCVATLMGTPVHLLIHALIQSANHNVAEQCNKLGKA